MYTLFVSRNAGTSYFPEAQSENLEELKEKAKEFDEKMLRWSIEDEEGETYGICKIHAGILLTMAEINKKNDCEI